MASIASRLSDMMDLDATVIPSGLKGGTTNKLHTGYLHAMLFGEPNTFKTTVAGEFGGPEHTLFIVTRRSEQLIPLANKGYKYVVAEDAESLRWALLHTEKAAEFAEKRAAEEGHATSGWAENWKKDPQRVVVVDDVTEGTNVLKEDHMYVFHEKGEFAGQTRPIKDPRQAYKKAGDELHDYLKVLLGRPQHIILIAVDKNFDVEGTSDNRTEPDLPNKMMKLTETELEYVFYFPHGDKMLTRTSKVVRSGQIEGKKEMVTWNEITFAKCKLPVEYLGQGVVAEMERKNLKVVWGNIQAAMKGEWKKPALTPGSTGGSSNAATVRPPLPALPATKIAASSAVSTGSTGVGSAKPALASKPISTPSSKPVTTPSTKT